MRKIQFQNDYYYHIYNRGVDKRNIFLNQKDYVRFLTSMKEFNRIDNIGSLRDLEKKHKTGTEPLEASRGSVPVSVPVVEFISYCLNPNHYHFLLKQLVNNGISKFMLKIGSGYTTYFNKKYDRSGVLFQGKFKAIPVKKDGYLLKLTCYINGNSQIHNIIKKAEDWPWSSYQDYLGLRDGALCNKQNILKQFKNINEYKKLTNEIIKESSEVKDEINKYIF